MPTLVGSCHCGALTVELVASRAGHELPVRTCTCGFCAMRRARWTSDPGGRVTVRAPDDRALNRYRFATGTADFVMCATCGVHVAAVMELDGGCYAVINIDVLSGAGDVAARAANVSFEGEATADRLARRKSTWTPARVDIG